MKASFLFRLSAILIVLFAAGHTLGFRQVDPRWGINASLETLKTTRFIAQGFHRTYWDFYVGFGLFVSLFLLFAAWIAWQLGAAPVRGTAWALTLCFAVVMLLSARFFFATPVIFSGVIFACLLAASVLISRP